MYNITPLPARFADLLNGTRETVINHAWGVFTFAQVEESHWTAAKRKACKQG